MSVLHQQLPAYELENHNSRKCRRFKVEIRRYKDRCGSFSWRKFCNARMNKFQITVRSVNAKNVELTQHPHAPNFEFQSSTSSGLRNSVGRSLSTKQPTRPTPIVMTKATAPTGARQRRRRKPILMKTKATTKDQQKQKNSAPSTLCNVGESYHNFAQQVQAHFIPRGTRLVQENTEKVFPLDAGNSANMEFQGMSELCVQRADWSCDLCHCHVHLFPCSFFSFLVSLCCIAYVLR